MKWLIGSMAALFAACSFAAAAPEISPDEMVKEADHVLIGEVAGADMIDVAGNQIADENKPTDPVLKNKVRLKIKVDKVLASTSKNVPKEVMVPLDPEMRYTLGKIKGAHSGHNDPFIVLLKGPDFEPIRPGRFGRPLADKDAVLKIYKKTHKAK